MLRTQIYLPEKLRKEIDSARLWKGESLSDYLRKAVNAKVEEDKKKKEQLKKLAKRITAGVKKSGWGTKEEVLKWQREIRRDRKIF